MPNPHTWHPHYTIEDVLNQFSDHPVSRSIACGEGWHPIIIECHRKLMEIEPNYRIVQIKEKFGGLRYYCTTDGSVEFREIIREAEREAGKTCESCGSSGTLREGGWIRTLCDTHEAEYQERIRLRNEWVEVSGQWNDDDPLTDEERDAIGKLRLAGCRCRRPLLGEIPNVGPRCRLCNTETGGN